ncbi:MAG: hypothetical protein ACP5IJ_02905 [Candidatus Nanoarchaeia archaeon]
MALFFKKKKEEEESKELPPLPPLPSEEELKLPEPEEAEEGEAFPSKIPQVPKLAAPPAPPAMPAPPIIAPEERATVFIRLDKYKDIMKTISEMESKLTELKETLDKIASIKNREAEIIDGWAAMLTEAKTKLDEVHSKLTKPEAS